MELLYEKCFSYKRFRNLVTESELFKNGYITKDDLVGHGYKMKVLVKMAKHPFFQKFARSVLEPKHLRKRVSDEGIEYILPSIKLSYKDFVRFLIIGLLSRKLTQHDLVFVSERVASQLKRLHDNYNIDSLPLPKFRQPGMNLTFLHIRSMFPEVTDEEVITLFTLETDLHERRLLELGFSKRCGRKMVSRLIGGDREMRNLRFLDCLVRTSSFGEYFYDVMTGIVKLTTHNLVRCILCGVLSGYVCKRYMRRLLTVISRSVEDQLRVVYTHSNLRLMDVSRGHNFVRSDQIVDLDNDIPDNVYAGKYQQTYENIRDFYGKTDKQVVEAINLYM